MGFLAFISFHLSLYIMHLFLHAVHLFALYFPYSCSVTKLCLIFSTPWTTACQAFLSFTISWTLFKFISTESVMLSNHLILYRPLLLLTSIIPSIRVFSKELTLHNRWPEYWSFSFIVSPPNEYSALISFRIDWFDLFAVQRTLKRIFSSITIPLTY